MGIPRGREMQGALVPPPLLFGFDVGIFFCINFNTVIRRHPLEKLLQMSLHQQNFSVLNFFVKYRKF
jgi:hypothetical protein